MPSLLSSWPLFSSKPGLGLLRILSVAALLVFSGVSAHAQQASTSASIQLNDKQSIYDMSPAVYATRDPSGNLSAREIYLSHRNNLRGERLPPGPINLSFDPVPHWFIIDIANNSRKSDWVLDFGKLSEGRTGLVPSLFIQDGQRGTVMVDALSHNGAQGLGEGLSGATVPLRLLPGQQGTLIIFMIPSDHAPLVITPRIIEAMATLEGEGARTDAILQNAVLALMSGCVVFFLGGMCLRRGVGFFPHTLFFLIQGGWFWLQATHIFTSLPGSADLPGVALMSGGLLALAVTQSIIAAQDSEAGDSLILYICASFALLAIMLFTFIMPENSILRLGVVIGTTALCYIVAAFKAFTVRRVMRWAGITAGFAWLLLMLSNAVPYMAAYGQLPLDPFFLSAPWLAMPLVCVLLVLSGAAYIRGGNLTLVHEVLRQAQRAQNATRIKQTKETADQARLLRVIEREREIMEDLRSRDAERTEEMRLAKITADEANRAKSAFLAVVSHEIRTPMTGIMGMVRLIQDTQMSREQREYTQTIQDSGDAMLALLNDILDFSKIEGGGMDMEVIDFDLHRVILSVAMLMNGHAAQRGIYLQTDIDADAPRYLKGDPTRLRQVLLNLAGNAIKFTPRGGVTIRLRAGDPNLVPENDPSLHPVSISVEDTGIGISAEAQQNLFNPFSQADSSIARKFGGTGLGLAICKRLIEAMGSEIELHSTEGQGTTFRFTLLLPPGDQQAAQDERPGEALGARNVAAPMDLLVIDDNAINRKVMEGLLGRDHHRVTTAASAADGINALRATPFDVVFMDIEMPDMDGVAAMQIIQQDGDERVRNTPVIALTGNVAQSDTIRYREAGMRDTLGKPIDPEKLRDILLQFGQIRPQDATVTASATPIVKTAPISFELSAADLDEDSFSHSIDYTSTPHVEEPADIAVAPVQAAPAVAAGPIDDTLFDAGILGALRTSLGETQLKDMMDGVFAHNKTVLPTMQTAFNENDVNTLRGCAHELKGMNGNFGLRLVSEITGAIERACRTGELSFDQVDELVFGELPEAMAKSEKAFNGQ